MAPRPRLVASDLDGTLLDARGAVSERTARSWSALEDAGIQTVIVTARPPRWVEALAPIVGDHGIVLCANGAFVYDVAQRRMLQTHGLDPRAVSTLIADLRARIPGITFGAECADGFHREDAFPDGGVPGVVDQDPESIGPLNHVSSPVGKLLAQAPGMEAERFRAAVEEVIGQRARLSVSCGDALAEIGPPQVTKAWALAQWASDRGIDARKVWAFGDMPNDIPMLRWAGVGWAVANADPSVLAVADRVTGTNDEHGVAQAIEPLLG
ncbi:HAD family hydrolase [Brachybacterium sp. EF45031]|uniref:HAD family hydrolase n=1 Tax=Brachybacterium sillae TaxID=2810536 RepID=UPI00217E9890|nr:HAD family hydrolase [Brachybacterium sillae]MCS6711997.1 HAD family hydrolase [Brachybacterium sillae]